MSNPAPVRLRNGDDVIAMQHNPPLDDPRAFVPHIPDDQDTDNDIGVSFSRWPDIIHLVDLQPHRSDGGFPFITYGLRNVHLGSPQFEEVRIHFVRPQPIREIGSDGVIVLIVEILHDAMTPGFVPTLAITCDSNHFLLASPQTMYVPRAVDSATGS